jgi:hypothetical protein
MSKRRPAVSSCLVLGAGLVIGWFAAGGHPTALLAGGSDRRGESVLMTAPFATEATSKVQITNDAVYYLNYSTGRLLASLPSTRQTAGASKILTEFAERDLTADFHLKPGTDPHFLMAAGMMGSLSEGWAPLYVLETTTGQMAIYRVMPQFTVNSNKPNFVLLEPPAPDPRLATAGRPAVARVPAR